MIEQAFGGDWTEDKLRRLREYLVSYRQIFTTNQRARYLTTWYVDAFAGTGSRTSRTSKSASKEDEGFGFDNETETFLEGSAKIALGIPSPFHRYLFVEQSKKKADALEQAVHQEFETLTTRVEIRSEDANIAIQEWSSARDWTKERAVVFLDPFGMQVEWATVRLLGDTKAVDLWYLFPLGSVIRMLTRSGIMEPSWEARLDQIFGSLDWRDRFYSEVIATDLFGDYEEMRRDATVRNVQSYIEERLKSAFVAVAPSLVLRNRRSSPLFAFCFAAANAKGAGPALSIATHLLKDG